MYRMRDPGGPPTQEQLDYARDLGIEIPEGVTKRTLSRLITQRLASRKPTEKQKLFADELGIEYDDDTTLEELGELIDEQVRQLSIAAMRANPALRKGKIIMYDERVYEIVSIGLDGERYFARLAALSSDYPNRNVMIFRIVTAEEVSAERLREIFNV